MASTKLSQRAWPPFMARAVSRDRLETFRRLFLAFALFTLAGVTVSLGFLGPDLLPERFRTGGAAFLVATLWVYGYRRGFRAFLLPAEALFLLLVMRGVREPVASLSVILIAVQYRALFGRRRDAVFVAGTYIATFLAYLVLYGRGILRPFVVVEVLALGFSAYLIHTLAEVLRRDREHASALRRSEDRYRSLFESNPWPMWVIDPSSLRILDVNPAAIEHYGFSRDEFLGMTLRDLRHPEDLPQLERNIPLIEGSSGFTSLVRHRKRDGSTMEVEVTTDLIDFEGGRARIAVGVDVSRRERTERALRESEQRFRAVAENLREALMITDTQDKIILANSRVREVLGYEPEEVVGQNATELLLPASQRHVFRDRLRRRLQGEVELYETELIRKDGKTIFAEVSASPYRDDSGRVIGTLGAISDISEHKRLEERLRQGMRLEAVGQLAGGVAHDFNNLLTVIKCHTELLLADLERTDPVRESIAEIARSANRGANLTQQLLAFSRKQLLQPRRVVLPDVVEESAPILRTLLDANGVLATTHDDSRVEIFADPLQLEHALATLVRNANDAMPRGGRITIATRAVEIGDEAHHTATQEIPAGRYAMLSVTDTGIGMTREVLHRVFEPFFTTKEPGEGSGLGLASIYGMVRQSGGFVDAESAPNAGTTFRIYLPIAGSAAAEQLPSHRALQPA